MNWKVIMYLSPLGVAVGFAGIYGLSGDPRVVMWLGTSLICGVVVIRHAGRDYFVHSLLACILIGLLAGLTRAAMIDTYLLHNIQMEDVYGSMPKTVQPRLVAIMMGLYFGAVAGALSGSLSVAVGKLMGKK